jgi:hypothetical protein
MLPMPFGITEIQVAGLPSRTLAGSLRVNFQLQPHCNARFGTRKLPATSIKIGFSKNSYCLSTTSSHVHTSVCSTEHLFMRRAPHSPYIANGRECLDAVWCRTPSLDHTSVCMRRAPNRLRQFRKTQGTRPERDIVRAGVANAKDGIELVLA